MSAALPCFLHKRLFQGVEPVTFQSHDNNFTIAPRLPLQRRDKRYTKQINDNLAHKATQRSTLLSH